MARLSDDEVRTGLATLPGWVQGDGEIRKEFQLASFRDALAFVVRLSYEAEAMNHHPDLDVRYNRVTVALSTHSEGGVTGKDLDLAGVIQTLSAPTGGDVR